MARRLQAEEDALVFEPPETIASSSRTVHPRGTRVFPPAAVAYSDEDLEEVKDNDSDNDMPLLVTSRKGKEEALPPSRPVRRKPRKPRPDTKEEKEVQIAEIMARLLVPACF